jgi:hypothetical protein
MTESTQALPPQVTVSSIPIPVEECNRPTRKKRTPIVPQGRVVYDYDYDTEDYVAHVVVYKHKEDDLYDVVFKQWILCGSDLVIHFSGNMIDQSIEVYEESTLSDRRDPLCCEICARIQCPCNPPPETIFEITRK